ncbi:MAG: hypothetical protein RIA71_05970 [Oceanicaulis sp.]
MIRLLLTASTLAAALAFAGFSAAHAQPAGHDGHGDSHGQDHRGDHGDDHAHQGEPLQPTLHEDIEAALAAGGSLVVAEVNGMVCDFCATAMTRTFGRRDEIGAVHVDLDTKTLQLVIREGLAMDDATITDLVTRSGYQLASIRRGTGA